MRRVLIVAALTLGWGGALVGLSATQAAAAETHSNCIITDDQGDIVSVTPDCSETVTSPPGQFAQPSANPCTGDTGTLTQYFRQGTFHANVNGAGDFWITGTQDGTVSFVPDDPSAPSGTGSFAMWFNTNDNNRNGNLTFTFDVEVHGSDGSLVAVHEVGHMSISATGATLSFDKPTLTCV